MRAIVHAPDHPHRMAFAEVDEPAPLPHQALIEVSHIALNYAELAFTERWPAGIVLGLETSGRVLRGAANGSGPAPGTRVTGYASGGGWARRRVMETNRMAEIPDGLDQATALPVAGVTALRALRTLDSVVGRRVLVTGAGGGVGRMAVQLAAHAGADVIALASTAERAKGLDAIGAREVVIGEAPLPRFDHVLDNVGGATLTRCYAQLPQDGLLVSIGAAGGAKSTIDFEQARLREAGRIVPFNVYSEGPPGADIATILRLAARGAIDAQIGWRGAWDRVADAVDDFKLRRVVGKAVLAVSQG